jgi:uncharacterized protein DUF5658
MKRNWWEDMAGEEITVGANAEAAVMPRKSGFAARWARIHVFAENARKIHWQVVLAIAFVVFYNVLGVLDIVSTTIGLRGLATEANPFIRSLMDNFSHGWIYTKLGLQAIVTVMILWFPHRLVLGIFALPMAYMGYVVHNNMQIIGML